MRDSNGNLIYLPTDLVEWEFSFVMIADLNRQRTPFYIVGNPVVAGDHHYASHSAYVLIFRKKQVEDPVETRGN